MANAMRQLIDRLAALPEQEREQAAAALLARLEDDQALGETVIARYGKSLEELIVEGEQSGEPTVMDEVAWERLWAKARARAAGRKSSA